MTSWNITPDEELRIKVARLQRELADQLQVTETAEAERDRWRSLHESAEQECYRLKAERDAAVRAGDAEIQRWKDGYDTAAMRARNAEAERDAAVRAAEQAQEALRQIADDTLDRTDSESVELFQEIARAAPTEEAQKALQLTDAETKLILDLRARAALTGEARA